MMSMKKAGKLVPAALSSLLLSLGLLAAQPAAAAPAKSGTHATAAAAKKHKAAKKSAAKKAKKGKKSKAAGSHAVKAKKQPRVH